MKKEQSKTQETNKETTTMSAVVNDEKQESKVINEILEKYRKHLEDEGKTKTTANGYVRNIAMYLSFVENELKGDVKALTEEYIEAFRASMIDSKYSVNTINTKLNSLLSYNRFCIDLKIMKTVIVDTSKYRVTSTMLADLRKK
ncbi:MAG: phage integrase N-terminal SAM-like domain-containing protein [Clostridia bacterium]|nr:phage integrase N-terminal SAM-like domain-containing protein [Clostridia bacterium]